MAPPVPAGPPRRTAPPAIDASLMAVLVEARALGFLGPGPVGDHVDHAVAYAAMVGAVPSTAADLGSGGGVPGLVLATTRWPSCRWVLIEANGRRCAFLERAIARLEVSDRVAVEHGRVEDVARSERFRHRFDLVVARSFGPPATTAECGAPLLRLGGELVVSDPPSGARERWPEAGLERLGLRGRRQIVEPFHLTSLRAAAWCPDAYPRRSGVPAKRPLFVADRSST